MNHETLWAREGDLARGQWERGKWSAFASNWPAHARSRQRKFTHGFDFRVESENGTKTMVKEETS